MRRAIGRAGWMRQPVGSRCRSMGVAAPFGLRKKSHRPLEMDDQLEATYRRNARNGYYLAALDRAYGAVWIKKEIES
ncbi:MAG: hypothetical protein JO353_13895 [Phycisphaerae bacterium]|nr:hypothetical protein [Phycisphaerae bacterium]